MNDSIKAAEIVFDELTRLAAIAEDEMKLAAKRTRHQWANYIAGTGTVDDVRAALVNLRGARQDYADAATRSDAAATVLLEELEKDRIERTDRAAGEVRGG